MTYLPEEAPRTRFCGWESLQLAFSSSERLQHNVQSEGAERRSPRHDPLTPELSKEEFEGLKGLSCVTGLCLGSAGASAGGPRRSSGGHRPGPTWHSGRL